MSYGNLDINVKEPLEEIASALCKLGNGDAYTEGVGAIEGFGMHLSKDINKLATSIDGLAEAIVSGADCIALAIRES